MATVTEFVDKSELKSRLKKEVLTDAAHFRKISFPGLLTWFKGHGFNTDDLDTQQEFAYAVDSLIKDGEIVVIGISEDQDSLGVAILKFIF